MLQQRFWAACVAYLLLCHAACLCAAPQAALQHGTGGAGPDALAAAPASAQALSANGSGRVATLDIATAPESTAFSSSSLQARRALAQAASPAPQTLAEAEGIPAAQVLRPNETLPDTGVVFLNFTFRVVGPNLLPVTPSLRTALLRTFDSVFALFEFTAAVESVQPAKGLQSTIVTAAALAGNTTAAGALPGNGSTTAATGAVDAAEVASTASSPSAGGSAPAVASAPARKLLQGRLNTASSARQQYEALEVVAVAYITNSSIFFSQGERRQPELLKSLGQSASAFGYKASFLPLQSAVVNNTIKLLTRLPPPYQEFFTSTYTVTCQFVGPNTAPVSVEAQNALEAAVSSAPKWIFGRLTQLKRTADNSTAMATISATTAIANGTVSPQEFAASIRPRVQQYLLGSGANGTVTVSAEYRQLPPFTVPATFINASVIAVPLPGTNTTTSSAASGSSGLSAGAIVGIVVGAVVGMAVVLAIIAIFLLRRRRPQANSHDDSSSDNGGVGGFDQKLMGWAIPHEDIQICRHSDGTEWLLGEGAYGRVYKGLRGGVQDVALKQLSHSGDGQLEKFIEEVGMLKGLNYDRNIVQFYGACIRQGCDPLLITEYMEGGDLCSAIQADTHGDLLWYGLGHRIALDIARGLYFLHSHEVVHSDMKSKNVLLSGAMNAKISDVGLAQLIDAHAEESPVLAWTLAYASPEVLMDEKCQLKSDIYSFGMVLWEIVTGTTPSTRGKLQTPETPQDCPEEVWALVQQCLMFKPEDRPSAKECFSRLQASCASSALLRSKSLSGVPPLPALPAANDASSQENSSGLPSHEGASGGSAHLKTDVEDGGSSGNASGGGHGPPATADADAKPERPYGRRQRQPAGGRKSMCSDSASEDSMLQRLGVAGGVAAAMAHSAGKAGGGDSAGRGPHGAPGPPNPFTQALSDKWSCTLSRDEADRVREGLGLAPAQQQLLTVETAAAQVAYARRTSFEGRKESFEGWLPSSKAATGQPTRVGALPEQRVQSDPSAAASGRVGDRNSTANHSTGSRQDCSTDGDMARSTYAAFKN